MRLRRRLAGLLLTLLAPLLLTAACVVDDAAEITSRVDGDRLLAAGDYAGAARAYERQLQASPGSARLEEKLQTARLRGAHDAADAALAAAARGKVERAAAAMSAAERLAPGHPYVRRARAEVDAVLSGDESARALLAEGRAALRDDPERAADLLAAARESDPRSDASVGLLREATLRAEAQRSARRAGEAWDAGDRDRAVRELAGASFAGRAVPEATALRDVIAFDLLAEAREGDLVTAARAHRTATAAALAPRSVRAIRRAYAGRLVAERDALLRAGRPALAALHEITAERAGGSPGTRARAAAAEQARLVVVVPAFDDRTAAAGGDRGVRVARAVAARLNAAARGGGLALTALGPDAADQFAAHPAALRLSGSVTAARGATGPRTPTTRHVDTVVGTKLGDNPAAAGAGERLTAARTALRDHDVELAKAREELRRLRASPFVGGGMDSAGLDKAIARQELAIAALVDQRETLVAAEQAARRDVARTPPSAQLPVRETRPLGVTSFRKVAALTAHVVLTDRGGALLDEAVTGSALHDERVHEGLPGAGLAADPDESPDAVGMERRAVDHLARLVSGRVRTEAARAAERYLAAADRARAAGRSPDAAEGYAVYLLVTPEGGSRGRERAARALREITGFEPAVRLGGSGRDP